MNFGERIKSLRQSREWTQPALAERLGIEQSWLSKIENDKCIPSSELLNRFTEVFEVPLATLLAGLDSDHVSHTLSGLPEVRGLLQENKYRIMHNSRYWLVASIAALAFGIALFITGAGKFFFSETQYIYESGGLIYDAEPENLYIEGEQIIERWVYGNWGPLDYEAPTSGIEAEVAIHSKAMELARRENYQQVHSREYRGRLFRVADSVDAETTDIFGNEVEQGSMATRVFHQSEVRTQPRIGNSVMLFAGIVLLMAGIGMAFAEWRISRLAGS